MRTKLRGILTMLLLFVTLALCQLQERPTQLPAKPQTLALVPVNPARPLPALLPM